MLCERPVEDISLDDVFAVSLSADPVMDLFALKCGSSVERNLYDSVSVSASDAELRGIAALDLCAVDLNLEFCQRIRLDYAFFRREAQTLAGVLNGELYVLVARSAEEQRSLVYGRIKEVI